MNVIRTLATLCFAILSISASKGQFLLSPQEMEADFQIFENSIQDLHPGLYWYYDSAEIAKRFNTIQSQLQSPMELSEFYTLLQGFYANLGCGHSWMSIPSQWRKYLDNASYRIPFDLFFEKDRAFISRDFTDDQKVEGLELLTINGEEVTDILERLLQYAPSDGYNQTRKRRIAIGNFSRYYQTMVRTDSAFQLTLRKGQEVLDLRVSGITREEFEKKRGERYSNEDPEEDLLSYKTLEGMGYLKIKTFSSDWIKSQKQNYAGFLKETFQKLRAEETQSLILDLRGNGGGDDDYGSLLCQYLIENEFRYFKRMESVTKRFDYQRYSNTKSLNLLAALVLRKDKSKPGFYTYNKARGLKVQKPKSKVFRGKLTVLVDGGTFSTAADVASILHSNERGVFVGQEVGGGYYGNNSAILYDIKLPNSKITYYIPIIRYYSAVDHLAFYGRGVEPNITVIPTFKGYIQKKDESLDIALSQSGK